MDQIKPLANSGPGMGAGNIPFAPGAQSGNFGGPPAPPGAMGGFDPTALFQMVKAYADALQGYINNNPGGGFPW